MTVYLNTYETWQAYGGPHEGGWWFTCGTPVQSVFFSSEDLEDFLDRVPSEELYELRNKATIAYTNGKPPTPKDTGYGGYTFVLGSDTPSTYQQDNSFVSYFEGDFAKSFPVEEIDNLETFQQWKDFVLDDTVYGQAMKVQFANISDVELYRTLVEIRDEHC
jgi:hypothetical protein